MPINEIETNLVYVTQDVIAHGVNTKGVMGAGVALAIKSKFSNASKVYTEYCKLHKPEDMLGTILVTKEEAKNKVVVHMFTQLDYGTSKQQVSYDALRSSFKALNEEAKKMGWTEVAMPRIGAGLGGGEWETIKNIIDGEAKDFTAVICVKGK